MNNFACLGLCTSYRQQMQLNPQAKRNKIRTITKIRTRRIRTRKKINKIGSGNFIQPKIPHNHPKLILSRTLSIYKQVKMKNPTTKYINILSVISLLKSFPIEPLATCKSSLSCSCSVITFPMTLTWSSKIENKSLAAGTSSNVLGKSRSYLTRLKFHCRGRLGYSSSHVLFLSYW